MKPTPIYIFDRDEVLRLILEPKTHTSIVPGKSGYTQCASMFTGDEETSPMRIERPLVYSYGQFIEELNGQETLEFEVPYTESDEEVEWIEGDGRAVIRDPDGNLVEFIIREVHDENGHNGTVKRVLCESAEYELNDEWLTGYTAQNVTLRTAMAAILQGTRFEPGIIMNTEGRNVNFEAMSIKAAVTELIDIFGGEKRERVEIRGNQIVRRYIDILPQRGEFAGNRFEYGKDIQNIQRQVDYTGIKTALYGFGRSQENDGPRIDFADVVWSKANGDPVDKPAGQKWVGDPEALIRYGYDGGTRHRFGVHESQAEDPGQLLLETWQELQQRNKPNVTYEMDVITLEHLTGRDHEKVRLGDIVYVIDREIKPTVEVEASVIRIEHDLNDPSRSKVVLGNFRESFFAQYERIRSVERIVDRKQGNWDAKETPEGAWEKAQWALSEAERQIEEANQELEQAKQRLDQAELDIAQAQQDITEAQTRLDNLDQELSELDMQKISEGIFAIEGGSLYLEGTLYTRSGGVFDGDIVARNLTLAGDIAAQNATITGTIIGSGATFQQVDIEQVNIINANIQDATITGTLNGVSGTFVGSIITGQDAYVGDNLYVGYDRPQTNYKGIWFGTESDSPRISRYSGADSLDVDLPRNGRLHVHGGGIYVSSNIEVYGDAIFRSTSNIKMNSGNIENAWHIETNFLFASGRVSTNRVRGYPNSNVINFGTSDRMILTATDSFPHYGLILGRVMVKGLDSSTEQVQIRNRGDTAYRDIAASDFITVSRQEYKEDIAPLESRVLDDVVGKTPIYSYRFKDREEPKLGVLYQESPELIRQGEDGISLESQIAVLWKALKEVRDELELSWEAVQELVRRVQSAS